MHTIEDADEHSVAIMEQKLHQSVGPVVQTLRSLGGANKEEDEVFDDAKGGCPQRDQCSKSF